MDQKEFLNNFELQFDEVEAGTLTMNTKFREIPEWGSLNALLIIAMVDSDYDVTITGDNIKSSETIEDIYNLILAKKQS